MLGHMTEVELLETVRGLLADTPDDDLVDEFNNTVESVFTYAEGGVMKADPGLVLLLADGRQVYLTMTVRGGSGE